ncbi:ribosome-associated heat shock protein Hsp15 [Natronocella acetinitrilica]|uniref:Heat shock protein 15 n=1 Tax=Natronocella acetinitrilica TaxID=414046 RepID=A0AAE3G2N5_9GAMM|nr:S4 domain-containing protein [Natronocella acetinitrilica]MCP1674710.1 ribosome-associated heat shock protein Hsp15 [Natronocella acetinitrilica]
MGGQESVRLDKWLWAARFFKTRRLATDAVTGGKVEVNGGRAKPARGVRVGDELQIRKDAYTFVVEVRDLSEQRGPARVAETLYSETAESQEKREALRLQLRAQSAAFPQPRQRPEKHDRRELTRFKRGE